MTSAAQRVLKEVERAGVLRLKPFLMRNLALYKQRKPAREGWAADDPMFQPRSPAVSLGKVVPTS